MYQWYLFGLIILSYLIAYFTAEYNYVGVNGPYDKKRKWLPVLIILIPLIIIAGTRISNFGDTAAYKIAYGNLPSSFSNVDSETFEGGKDIGFRYFGILVKSFFGEDPTAYLTIIAAISLICVFCVYKKYSTNIFITTFLFIASGDYLQWCYNGIRQFLVVSILFACFGLLLKKKYVMLIIIIILLSFIHQTVLIMIPMIFIVQGEPWNRNTLLVVLLVVVAIAFVDNFSNLLTEIMAESQYSGEVNQYKETEGTNILRVIVFSIPAVMSFVFRKQISAKQNKVINICVNMSVISTAVYWLSAFTSGIFIGRIPIYFSLYNYILLPWLIDNFFEKHYRFILYVLLIVFYLAFYYYQTSNVYGL